MARAAVKARQQQAKKAAPQQQRSKSRGGGRRKHASGGNPNQQLFFVRMRRSAKPVYVILAVLFAATFAFLGVGSGNNSGLDQLFQGLNPFHHSGTSVSSAQKYISKHPNDPKGYRDLATAYEGKNDQTNAINALTQYTDIRRKDVKAWLEMAGLQLNQAQNSYSQYANAFQAQQLAAPSQAFLPTGKLGTAIGSNKVEQAATSEASSNLQTLQQQTSAAYQAAVTDYQRAADLQPRNANNWLQLGQAAQEAANITGDTTSAVNAYKHYLKLNPDPASAAQIKQVLKQLQPAPTSAPAKKKKK
jgi:regulator of sirC expression with transglutaminase-like and TPR domain